MAWPIKIFDLPISGIVWHKKMYLQIKNLYVIVNLVEMTEREGVFQNGMRLFWWINGI